MLWIAVGFLAVWLVGVMILHAGGFISLAVLIALVFVVAHLFTTRQQ